MSLLSALPEAASGALREAALRSLKDAGLPTKKTEAWRFTPVSHLVGDDYETRPAELLVEGDVEVVSAHELVGSVSANTHFAALNTLCHEQVHVVRGGGPVTLRYRAPGEGKVSYPRVLVLGGRTEELRLVERFEGGAGLVNAVTEVILEDGARLDHTRVHQQVGQVVGRVAVRAGRDARYRSRVFSIGGDLMRLDLQVHLSGENGECELDGAYHVGAKEHVDHHVWVGHEASHTRSQQRYRGVLDGKGTAVFDGQAIVAPGVKGTEAHQENRNLLMSDGATVHTKPHLEINNSEVVASHGATVGALEPEQLFYLRARGVPETLARAILTDAFLRAIVDGETDEVLRSELSKVLHERLPKGAALDAMEMSS